MVELVIGASAPHSRWGGSSADRWMNCAASSALIASIPAKASSRYAAEGTAAHALAAACLKEDLHPTHFLGETMEGFEVDQGMCDAVRVYLEAVTHELAKTKDGELYIEQGFILDVPKAARGEVYGTNDAMVYHPSTGRLAVFDYKHGVGYSVSVEDNAQLKFYAAGAVFSNPKWKIAEVELIIVQPRALDAESAGAVKRWPLDPLELMEFQANASDAIVRAKSYEASPVEAFRVNGELVPAFNIGSWCRWCDAAAVCPAREKQALEAATLDFADVTEVTADQLPAPQGFDPARLAKVLDALKIVSGWQAQVQEYVEAIMLQGVGVPGYKVVEKIGRRDPAAQADHHRRRREAAEGGRRDEGSDRRLQAALHDQGVERTDDRPVVRPPARRGRHQGGLR